MPDKDFITQIREHNANMRMATDFIEERLRPTKPSLLAVVQCRIFGHKPDQKDWMEPNCLRCRKEIR